MPKLNAVADPVLAQQLLDKVEQIGRAPAPVDNQGPSIDPGRDAVFDLCGAYLQSDGVWATEFEVRELTGRDEEYLGRIKHPGKILLAMLERGLVRVGSDRLHGVKVDDVLDSVLAGDWETILLAIRIVSFGATFDGRAVCRSCGEEYPYSLDLLDVDRRRMSPDEIQFPVVGKNGDRYEVSAAYGTVQRKALLAPDSMSLAEIATVTLKECLLSVNGRPALPGDALSMPIADRRKIIDEIDQRRVGPNLGEVRTKCPACDEEQPTPLNVIALFQG